MLNERIRILRTTNNISQVELAKHLGVTKQSVSNWENDNIQPSIEMLMKLSNFFNVSTDFLLGMENRIYIEITGLSQEEVSHIQLLISDITKNK